jgi:hypothetical protein
VKRLGFQAVLPSPKDCAPIVANAIAAQQFLSTIINNISLGRSRLCARHDARFHIDRDGYFELFSFLVYSMLAIVDKLLAIWFFEADFLSNRYRGRNGGRPSWLTVYVASATYLSLVMFLPFSWQILNVYS